MSKRPKRNTGNMNHRKSAAGDTDRMQDILKELKNLPVGGDKARQLKKQIYLRVLAKCMGQVSKTSRILGKGFAPSTVYEWMKTDKAFEVAVTEHRMTLVFKAESAIFDKVEKGDTQAIIFVLKTLGAPFGWSEKQSLTGQMIHGVVDITGRSDGENMAKMCEAVRLWDEQQKRIKETKPGEETAPHQNQPERPLPKKW